MNGLLGKGVAGTGASYNTIYAAPATAGSHTVANVHVANTSAADVTVTLAISTIASPAASDYLTYDLSIPANGTFNISGIVMSPSEAVLAKASTAGISVRVHGFQKGV